MGTLQKIKLASPRAIKRATKERILLKNLLTLPPFASCYKIPLNKTFVPTNKVSPNAK